MLTEENRTTGQTPLLVPLFSL